MTKLHFKSGISTITAVLLLLSVGCFKKKEAPEPPTARARLVQETFTSLENRDHQAALKKIERLRELDSGNIFLASLNNTEKSNASIAEIQSMVNEGKLEEAIKLTDDFMFKEGRSDDFLAIQNELQTLKQLKEAVDAVNDSANVTRLARNAAKIKMIAARYKPAEVLLPLANEKIALARKLYTSEKRKAVDDLSIEVIGMFSQKDPKSIAALSLLALENPEHPVILEYLDYISGVTENIPSGSEKQKNIK